MAFKKPTIHQIKPDIRYASIYLRGLPKWGKEQPISEPILTETGWKTMGEIQIGDQVYGDDGNLHKVKGVYPQGIKDVYKVSFSDGTSTRCGLEHLWSLRAFHCKDNTHPYRILHLEDIMDDYVRIKPNGKLEYKYSLPPVQPMNFPKKDLLIDPYLMGLLLGDGGFTTSVITFTNSEEEVLQDFEDEILKMGLVVSKRESSPKVWQYKVKKEMDQYKNKLRTFLDSYNLLECGSREKFIPKDYLYSNIYDRQNLLRGLINTDGTIQLNNDRGTRIVFYSYSSQLAKDVTELARSLGYKVSLQEHDRTNENSTLKYREEIEYVVSIMGEDFSSLNLSSKHRKKLRPNYQKVRRHIVNIELVGQEECQCIWVDNPSHLYITKDYIPTHNTTCFRDVILEKFGDPEKGLMIKCGAESGDSMLDEINSVQVETWTELMELVNWLIDQKGKEHQIEMVSFDTVDELIKMAEKEAMKVSYKESVESGKPLKPRSINQAFGGFSRGPAYVVNALLTPLIGKLKSNFGVWGIAHTKMKINTNSVDSLNPDLAVQQLTSNLDNRYETCFSGLLDIMVTGTFENNDVIGSVKKDKKEVSLVDPTKQIRRLYFRSTSFVEAGGRIADYADLPESMVFELNENNAKTFIEIIELGMEKSKLKYRHFNNTKKVEETTPKPSPSPEELYSQVVERYKGCNDVELKARIKEMTGGKLTQNTSVEVLQEVLNLLKK